MCFIEENLPPITGDKNFQINRENYKMLDHELCKTTWTQCAHAMAINSKFYNTALSEIKKDSKTPIDMIYCLLQQKGFNTYTFLPSLAWQRRSFSDIENKITYYYGSNLNCF